MTQKRIIKEEEEALIECSLFKCMESDSEQDHEIDFFIALVSQDDPKRKKT